MRSTQRLTIIQMNDTHAYMDLHPEIFWTGTGAVYRPAGGYARIATLIKQIRVERGEGVLFLDNGDTLHGTFPAVDEGRGAGADPERAQAGRHDGALGVRLWPADLQAARGGIALPGSDGEWLRAGERRNLLFAVHGERSWRAARRHRRPGL